MVYLVLLPIHRFKFQFKIDLSSLLYSLDLLDSCSKEDLKFLIIYGSIYGHNAHSFPTIKYVLLCALKSCETNEKGDNEC
jgi:hypothetical protein